MQPYLVEPNERKSWKELSRELDAEIIDTLDEVERYEILPEKDIQKSDLNLQIPDDVLFPGGLISLGVEALSQPGFPNIPQYNLPVVLTTIANAIAGKLIFAGVWPNLYNIKVGPTSSGKTSSDLAVVKAMSDAGVKKFYGVTDFASGPALMRSLVDDPMSMIVIDESTSLFKRYLKSDPNTDGKRDALLEIFSKSGQIISKAYSDSRNHLTIERPCLSLTGNATPVIFDAIKQEDFDTGTMQRFDFWCYDGDSPDRGVSIRKNSHLEMFVNGIFSIFEANPGGGNLRQSTLEPMSLDITPEGQKALEKLSRDVIKESNAASSDGERGIISRKYHLTIKYAMVHLAATRPVESIGLPMEARDIEYGEKVAWMLADWKINVLRRQIVMGDFHKQCEMFKKAIIAAIKAKKRPTFKALAGRRPELKNWQLKDSKAVIEVLLKRGDILLRDEKRPTAYYLTKFSER